jgi:phage pi2 protein 07
LLFSYSLRYSIVAVLICSFCNTVFPDGKKLEFVYQQAVKQQKDNETVSISNPTTEKYWKALVKSNVTLNTPTWNKKPPDLQTRYPKMQEHTWLAEKEDSLQNRKLYMAYLNNKDNIDLPEGGKLFEGSTDSGFLGVWMEEIETKTKGNIDAVIAHSRHQELSTTRQHMWGGIELKKSENNSDLNIIQKQVILQHLSASYLNDNTGILTIMTDLCQRWHFYWFSNKGNQLMKYEANMLEARYLIHHMMDKSSSDDLTPEDFLNRGSWKQAVHPTDPSSLAAEDSQDKKDEYDGGESNSDGMDDQSERAPTQSDRTQAHNMFGAKNTSGSDMKNLHRKRSRGKDSWTEDSSLDFMDEEEQEEEIFRAVVRNSLAGMFPPEVVEEGHSCIGPPKDIVC